MKYFCISDVHGQYAKMLDALNAAGFNKETDTLVSVGDLFDRGYQSQEVLEYVMSCPHRLLCMGNHDLRLMEIIKDPVLYNGYDYQNGILETLKSFLHEGINDIWGAFLRLRHYTLLKQYFHECCAAFEFSNLIITHGWLPTYEIGWYRIELFSIKQPDGSTGDWHKARGEEWNEAVWANTEKMITHHVYPEKTMLIGHWHAWRLAEKFGEKRQLSLKHEKEKYINCDTYIHDYKGERKFIAIDGCTNYPYGGKVNVYIFESDEEPQIIKGGFGRWYY